MASNIRVNRHVLRELSRAFGSEKNADCVIVFCRETNPLCSKDGLEIGTSKQVLLEHDFAAPGGSSDIFGVPLPAHRWVLQAASDRFASQLERWDHRCASGRPVLKVPLGSADEVTAASAAIEYAYTGDVNAGSTRQALGIRQQGEYLGIKDCAADCDKLMERMLQSDKATPAGEAAPACTAAPAGEGAPSTQQQAAAAGQSSSSGAANASSLQRPPVLELYGCEALWPDPKAEPTFAAVLDTAAALLVAHFGDALKALNTPCLEEQLLELPATGVEALLGSNDFGTDDESSVLLLLASWMKANWGRTDEQARRRLCRAAQRPFSAAQLLAPPPAVVAPLHERPAALPAATAQPHATEVTTREHVGSGGPRAAAVTKASVGALAGAAGEVAAMHDLSSADPRVEFGGGSCSAAPAMSAGQPGGTRRNAGRSRWGPGSSSLNSRGDALTAAVAGAVDTDVLAASNTMLAALLDAHGRNPIAAPDHGLQSSKARKLARDASARVSMSTALAQSSDLDAQRLRYLEAALAASSQLGGAQATMVEEVANMLAMGLEHDTVAKVIGGPREQREFISLLASMSDEVRGVIGELISNSATTSSASMTVSSRASVLDMTPAPFYPATLHYLQDQLPPASLPNGGYGGQSQAAVHQPAAGQGGGLICYECGQRGHGYMNCPVLNALDPAQFTVKLKQYRARQQQERAAGRGQRGGGLR